MKRLLLAAVLLGLPLTAHMGAASNSHASTLMADTRYAASRLRPVNCPAWQPFCNCDTFQKLYPFACGTVWQTVCKDTSRARPIYGQLAWQEPDGTYGGCRWHDAYYSPGGGAWDEWYGLDQYGGKDAQAIIARWRNFTCATVGVREGKYGKVVSCGFVVGVPYDYSEDVE